MNSKSGAMEPVVRKTTPLWRLYGALLKTTTGRMTLGYSFNLGELLAAIHMFGCTKQEHNNSVRVVEYDNSYVSYV